MSPARLHARLVKVETQRRPTVVAAILLRGRQCAPADLGAFLLAELTGRDWATVDAIMAQLPDTALEALIGPDAVRLMETLSNAQLAALAKGDPAAMRQFQRGLRSLQPQEGSCP